MWLKKCEGEHSRVPYNDTIACSKCGVAQESHFCLKCWKPLLEETAYMWCRFCKTETYLDDPSILNFRIRRIRKYKLKYCPLTLSNQLINIMTRYQEQLDYLNKYNIFEDVPDSDKQKYKKVMFSLERWTKILYYWDILYKSDYKKNDV